MRHEAILPLPVSVLNGLIVLLGLGLGLGAQGNAQAQASKNAPSQNDRQISAHAQRMIAEGRRIFRFDTFLALSIFLRYFSSWAIISAFNPT